MKFYYHEDNSRADVLVYKYKHLMQYTLSKIGKKTYTKNKKLGIAV